MTPKEVLQGVKTLLSDPNRWTSEALAKDIHREATNPESKEAVCWCLIGATQKVSNGNEYAAYEARTLLREQMDRHYGYQGIPAFNDECGYLPVMDVIDKALKEFDE